MSDFLIEVQPIDPLISIWSNEKIMVTIKNDMTIEYGESYNPDETATVFWEAILLNGMKIKELKEENEKLKEYKYKYESLCD